MYFVIYVSQKDDRDSRSGDRQKSAYKTAHEPMTIIPKEEQWLLNKVALTR